ncbi:hypothetical protein EGW08_004560 [Elysia chlorotica]|uniref:Uncharacterized protein n=1 Tax=Elysia chlorotica TaxID=188477 RepID=A0A3S1BNC7_ELYCH|nr:hypothetical protein EGW08_004560 [Elysia chlorotica]
MEQMRKKPNMLKNFITNASFKAKKLPDDIDIVDEDYGNRLLAPVDEEGGSGLTGDHSVSRGLKARLKTKLGGGGDRARSRESNTGSVVTYRKDSPADLSYNNAGRRGDGETAATGGGGNHHHHHHHHHQLQQQQQQSPRGEAGEVGGGSSHKNNNGGSGGGGGRFWSVGGSRRDSDGTASSQGDRSGSKVKVDMLEMEPIKGRLPKDDDDADNNDGDEDGKDFYDDDGDVDNALKATAREGQSPRQGLWSPPSTPSPTSAPAHSPLLAASVRKSSREKTQALDSSGAGGDHHSQGPDSSAVNGKAVGINTQ